MSKSKSSGKRTARAPQSGILSGHRPLQAAVAARRWEDAAAEAGKLLMLRPNDAYALKVLGSSHLYRGQELEAIPPLQKALALSPNDPELANNLGIAHLFAAHWDHAIQYFRRALALNPKDYVIWKNLGRAFVRLQRPREAVEALAQAIELHPGNYEEALILLALALSEGGQPEQAFGIYRELYRNEVRSNEIISSLIFCALKLSEFDEIGSWLDEFRSNLAANTGGSSDPLASLSFPGISWQEHYRIATHYALGALPNHCLAQSERWQPQREPGRRKLRIGYFSGDFRRHPVGYLIPQVIESHDRSHFEIIGYATGDDDKSEIRARIARAFDRFVDLGKLASEEALETIRKDNLDLLINLQGWTNNFGSELFAERAARVQLSWLGYPGTMGHTAFADYVIGDPNVTPLDAGGYFSETIAQVDSCYLPMDIVGGPPAPWSRANALLPEDAFVFCSFNNRYKINPMLVDLWAAVLQQCPSAMLWLSDGPAVANQNLHRHFSARGIAIERIAFAPRVASIDEHRARIGAADLALDTMPYNSHSSGLDMLWAGVPMVTAMGNTLASRVGASLLSNAGIPELITNTPDDYRELAINLYYDRDRLRRVKDTLCAGRTSAPLWDTAMLTRSLERIYRRTWEDTLAGIRAPIAQQTS